MQKLSIKKISILGMVLLAASAVTAAVIPSKSDKSIKAVDGSLTQTSDDNQLSSVTCNPDSDSQISQQACTASSGNATNPSATTAGSVGSSNQTNSSQEVLGGDDGDGDNNTSSRD